MKKRLCIQHIEQVADTPWGQTLLFYAQEAVHYCITLTKHALELMKQDAKLLETYENTYQSGFGGIEPSERCAGTWSVGRSGKSGRECDLCTIPAVTAGIQ